MKSRNSGILALVLALGALLGIPGIANAQMDLEIWRHSAAYADVDRKYAEIYNATHPDVHIEVIAVPDMWDALAVAVAGGVPPEMWGNHPTQLGVYHDLLEPYPEDLFDYDALMRDFYGIENWLDESGQLRYWRIGMSARMMFYNQDHVAEAGLPFADQTAAIEMSRKWTWDEFLEYARLLTRWDGDEMSVAGFTAARHLLWMDLFFQHGGHVYTEDGRNFGAVDHPEIAADVSQFIYDLVYEHRVSRITPGGFTDQSTSIEYGGPWLDRSIKEIEGLRAGYLYTPTPYGGWDPLYGYAAGELTLSVLSSVPPDRKKAAFEFISWLYGQNDYWVDMSLAMGSPTTYVPAWGDERLVEDLKMQMIIEASPYLIHMADDPSQVRDVWVEELIDKVLAGEQSPVAGVERAIVRARAVLEDLGGVTLPLSHRYVPPSER